MNRLEEMLWDIPLAEREEALQYYQEYFDDAGEEKEAEVIRALGSPERVAEQIKMGLWGERVSTPAPSGKREKEAGIPPWGILLMILGLLVLFPAIAGIISGLVGGLMGLVAGWFGLIIGAGACCLGFFAAAIVLLILGAFCAGTSPIVCMALVGLAMILASLGLLSLMLTVLLGGKVTPAIFRGIKWLTLWLIRKVRSVWGLIAVKGRAA